MPVGVRGSAAYRERMISLLAHDTLFVFSDGVTETMNTADEFYGSERLRADLRAASALRPEELVRSIKMKVDLFAGDAPKFDDVTMLALRWQPGETRLQAREAHRGADSS